MKTALPVLGTACTARRHRPRHSHAGQCLPRPGTGNPCCPQATGASPHPAGSSTVCPHNEKNAWHQLQVSARRQQHGLPPSGDFRQIKYQDAAPWTQTRCRRALPGSRHGRGRSRAGGRKVHWSLQPWRAWPMQDSPGRGRALLQARRFMPRRQEAVRVTGPGGYGPHLLPCHVHAVRRRLAVACAFSGNRPGCPVARTCPHPRYWRRDP